MLFFESPIVDAGQLIRNSIFPTNGTSCGELACDAFSSTHHAPCHEVRWSPPTERRAATKFAENTPPFCSSRFLSSSPPMSRNRNLNGGYANGASYIKSSLTLNKRSPNDETRKSSRVLNGKMDHYSNSNEDSPRPSNSLLLYQAEHERGNGQSINSPHEVRREFGICPTSNPNIPLITAMPSHIPSGYAVSATPAGTKMLVDPATGQQYFVPTAQPQVAYYPVFYNTAPPPQSQPIFYQAAAAPAGYFLPSQQHMPSSPTHHSSAQPLFFQQSQHDVSKITSYTQSMNSTPSASNASYVHSPAYGSPPYRVEIPPSNASVTSSHFQRNHESRVSIESGASSASSSSRNKHSDDRVSPATATKENTLCYRGQQVHSTPTSHPTKLFPDNWLHNSARYSSATSSSSGFYSGDVVLEKSHLSARFSETSESQGSPTHRAEQPDYSSKQGWHGDLPKNLQSPRKEYESNSMHCGRHVSQNRDSSSSPKCNDSSPLLKPTQKAIRMDIDLSQPIVAEKVTAVERAAVKANITPPTAFTISFDDNALADENVRANTSAKSPKKTPMSLQDAARQAPTGRRLMRRTVASKSGETPTEQCDDNNTTIHSRQDPKEYLFLKMFENSSGRAAPKNDSNALNVSPFGSKRDVDTTSEAGTYIVEKECKMVTSQLLDTDEDCSSVVSSSTSTTISDSGSNRPQETPRLQLLQRPVAVRTTGNPPPSLSARSAQQQKSPPPIRRSLMSDLRKLREEKSLHSVPGMSSSSPRRLPPIRPTTTANVTRPSGTSLLPSIANQEQKASNVSTRLCQTQSRFATGSTSNSGASAFRRADGGRFSMRSATPSSSCATRRVLVSQPRPPFRTGGSKPVNKQSQETPEMMAWLRRKEYDPRKAAAEARKMQQLKQRENYLSNRSVSYHNANSFLSSSNSAFHQWHKSLGNDRSNKSFDNLSRLGEESGVDEFAQMSITETSNNLRKTVDALTEKCNKSIELIKLCNKNTLSPSVENLLQSVVESSSPVEATDSGGEEEGGEKISDRLERLSSAFDAIQKYLEEQSSSTPSTKLLGLIPSSLSDRPSGSSTQRLLLDISVLSKARNAMGSTRTEEDPSTPSGN